MQMLFLGEEKLSVNSVMLMEKYSIRVMLNLIQHLFWFVEIAGQARNDAAQNKRIFCVIISLTTAILKIPYVEQRR